jgi:hypothetical protein
MITQAVVTAMARIIFANMSIPGRPDEPRLTCIKDFSRRVSRIARREAFVVRPIILRRRGRSNQTLKNRILLENYYLPGDLEACIGRFVEATVAAPAGTPNPSRED